MKKCKECGRELPKTDFAANKRSKDGLFHICTECRNKLHKVVRYRAAPTPASGDNPLTAFPARELILELRRRGYEGQLKLTQLIKV